MDDAARRILFAMFDSGVFDNPLPATPATEVSTPQHQQVATQVAEAGTVLLKNHDDVLPLSRHIHSIALIGPTGDDAMFVSGRLRRRAAGARSGDHASGRDREPRGASGCRCYDRAGSAGDGASPDLVDPLVLTPSSGTGPRLLGQYWSNGEFTGAPTVTEVDQHVDAAIPPISPAPAVWSAKWTGTLTPTESGLYRSNLVTTLNAPGSRPHVACR